MPLKLLDEARFSIIFMWTFKYGVFANNCLLASKCCIQCLCTTKQFGIEYMKKICSDIDNTIVMMSDGIHFHWLLNIIIDTGPCKIPTSYTEDHCVVLK